MASSKLTFRRGFMAAVFVLLVLSLLPHRYTGYATVVRSVTELAMRPATKPLNAFTGALRRRDDQPVLGEAEQLSEKILTLEGEVLALRERERQLERTVAELQGLRRRLGDTYEYRVANVVSRSSEGSGGTVQINVGSRHGIQEGMAVVEGASVVGRITQVGPTSSVLSLVTANGTLVEVVAAPVSVGGPVMPHERRGRLLLQSAGPDLLMANEVDRQLPVEAEDFARVMDERWPAAVQGMIVGRVMKVEADPDDPLLKRISVRPMSSLRDLDSVTVIVPRRAGDQGTDELAGSGR